jgi:hypothetical protein
MGLKGLEVWRWQTGLESLELRVEETSIGIYRAEALSWMLSSCEAVLLECAVDLSLLLELLERVGGPAGCV